MNRGLSFIFLFLLINAQSFAATKSGVIVDETWIKAESPYNISGDILVAALTIEPGVEIRFLSNYVFEVAGQMQALGTAEEPILFARSDSGISWGGIFFNYSSEGSTLSHCAIEGGTNSGVRIVYSSPTLNDCWITNNSAIANGGGVSVQNGSPIFRNCHIAANSTVNGGGGLYVSGSVGETRLENCEVRGNRCWSSGGGIYTEFAKVIIDGTRVIDNLANSPVAGSDAYGGGIHAYFGSFSAVRSDVIGNIITNSSSSSGLVRGGGIAFRSGNHSMRNCRISNNAAFSLYGGYWFGAGVYAEANVTIQNCIISDNKRGGAIMGGGLYAAGAVSVLNSAICYNDSVSIHLQNGFCDVLNSIIFFNAPEGGNQIDGSMTVTFSDVQNGYNGLGNLNVNPIFQARTNFMLVNGSGCIDRGSTNSAYNDLCFPPSKGMARNDMGPYGGPGACEWASGAAPSILQQPRNQSSCIGQTVILATSAVGIGQLSYQWFLNQTNALFAQTNASLSLTNIQKADAGYYSVQVSSAFGQIMSDSAAVSVFDACVDVHMYAGLSITGRIGKTYVLSGTSDFFQDSWVPLSTNTLSTPEWFFLDLDSPNQSRRFYRVDEHP